MPGPVPGRAPTAADLVAEEHLRRSCGLDPVAATDMGVAGYDHLMTDYSPSGDAARAELARATLRAADRVEVHDDVDRIGLAALRERLGVEVELQDAGLQSGALNVIASPLQDVRTVFDLMAADTPEQVDVLRCRLEGVPAALAGYTDSLRHNLSRGRVPAARQVRACARQCDEIAVADGYFTVLARTAGGGANDPGLAGAADRASAAYARLGNVLRTELAPVAPLTDAVGAEVHHLWSRYFLGTTLDPEQTYTWGLDEVARIETEMARVAARIVPGGGIEAAVNALDADPARRIGQAPAFAAWLQELADRTVADLAGTHFDIPDPLRRIDCKIAPTVTGGIYYTGPSEDLTRPGTMWWSVPEGDDAFSTWRETTTVFHEGVPGHHLQVGQTVVRSGQLNRWRRLACWTSGHGEGWALYAERLMAELGYLDDDGDLLGMLDGAALRAARVVVDLGVHHGYRTPPELGGQRWDADAVWRYLRTHTRLSDAMLRFEVDRYLGWPGQASSYKIGERSWLDLRAQVQRTQGPDFDLRRFHQRALDVGSVGLDVLAEAVVETGTR